MTAGELVTGLGYLTAFLLVIWSARERRLLTSGMGLVAAAGFAGGVLGANVSQLVFEGALQPALLLDPRAGGKSLLGGLLIGWVCVIGAKKVLGIKRPTGDLFALALPGGEAVGRIGCYLNGCCFGTKTDASWAVWQHGAMRHPAQLYSAVSALAIFALLLVLRDRFRREGDLFKAYLLLFGVTRFGLEFLRENNTFVLGLTPMQWFCLELTAVSAISFAIAARRRLQDA